MNRPRPRRRAIASLELVLALPLLVFLAAMILAIGRVGLTRAGANVQARRDAWARPIRNGAAETGPLPAALPGVGMLADGEVRGLASGAVDIQAPLAPMLRTSVAVRTRLFVLLDPLDYNSAPFGDHPRFTPDRRLARLAGASLAGLAGVTTDLRRHAGDAAGKMSTVQSGMQKLRQEADALKDRKDKVLEEIRRVAADEDLSPEERDKKLKELADELADIKKAEDGIKDAGRQFGGVGGR